MLKTRVHVIRTGFATQILNSQPKLVTNNALKCAVTVTHLPVDQLLIHIIVQQRSSMQFRVETQCYIDNPKRRDTRRCLKLFLTTEKLTCFALDDIAFFKSLNPI